MIPYNYHKIPQQRFDHNDRLQTPASNGKTYLILEKTSYGLLILKLRLHKDIKLTTNFCNRNIPSL